MATFDSVPVSFFRGREVEKSTAHSSKSKKSFFPIEPFFCCPGLLPETLQKIQDCTHGMLVIGTLAGVVLVASSLLRVMDTNSCSTNTWCFARRSVEAFLMVAFVVPVVMYCLNIIQQYDETLRTKQLHSQEVKEDLLKSYQQLLQEMHSLLARGAESASGLAERAFESKRRDFKRFLERSKRFAKENGCNDDIMREFRRFCANWLLVFKECSIDPVKSPKVVMTTEELMQCQTIDEVADLCQERLRVTEVRFISVQRDQDTRVLQKSQKTLKRLATNAPKGAPTSLALTRMSNILGQVTGVFSEGAGACQSKCSSPIFVSPQHMRLAVLFFFGAGLLVLKTYMSIDISRHISQDSAAMIALLLLVQLSVTLLLVRFEEIDAVQKLEREVKELKQQRDAVEKQQKTMAEFWGTAQQLTDLWLYRTVPRLELFKEIQCHLEDAEEEEWSGNLAGANQWLESLEAKLGPLADWRNDGTVGLEDKKLFGRQINELCHEAEFEHVLVKLGEVVNGDLMKRVEAMQPAAASFVFA